MTWWWSCRGFRQRRFRVDSRMSSPSTTARLTTVKGSAAGALEFGLGLAHRRRIDHRVDPVEVARVVPEPDIDAQRRQAVRCARRRRDHNRSPSPLRPWSTSARPHMPTPPIPMKWRWRPFTFHLRWRAPGRRSVGRHRVTTWLRPPPPWRSFSAVSERPHPGLRRPSSASPGPR